MRHREHTRPILSITTKDGDRGEKLFAIAFIIMSARDRILMKMIMVMVVVTVMTMLEIISMTVAVVLKLI